MFLGAMEGPPLFIQPWESDPVVLPVRTSQHHFPQVSPHLHTFQIRGEQLLLPSLIVQRRMTAGEGGDGGVGGGGWGSRGYFGCLCFWGPARSRQMRGSVTVSRGRSRTRQTTKGSWPCLSVMYGRATLGTSCCA